MTRTLITLALVAALTPVGGPAVAQAGPPIGCYRADRQLGTAARASSGNPELETFRLLHEGRVERPEVGRPPGYTGALETTSAQRWWAYGSRWHAANDTLHVRLSTGLSGWDLELVPESARTDTVYVGVARYLTDVVVRDSAAWQPPQVTVRVVREACTPRTPGLTTG